MRFRVLLLCSLLPFACGSAATWGEPVRSGPGIRELVEVADVDSLAVSPDGRLVAFRVSRASIQRNSYDLDWYVADLITGQVRRVGGGGAPIYDNGIIEAEPPVWSPDSHFFFHRALVDGAIGVWRTAVDGSGSSLVAGGDANVEGLTPGPGGTAIYVTGPTRDQVARAEVREYDSGILVDSSVDLAQNLFRGGYVHGRLSSERLIGRWYSRGGLLWRAPRTRHRLDLATLTELQAEPAPPPKVDELTAADSSITTALTATAPSGAVASATGPEDHQLLEVREPNGARVTCASVECGAGQIEMLSWRPGRAELLFAAVDPLFNESWYGWTPADGRVRRITEAAGLLSGGRSPSAPCALTASAAVCVSAGAVSPPRLERIDLDSGRREELFDPNQAIRKLPAPRVEQLSWRLADGRTASGTLLMPPGSMPVRAPLFVTYYYCPGYLRGGTGDAFPFAALVNAGFVVGCLNVVPFVEWGDGVDHDRTALTSTRSLVDLLDRRGLIDRSRVGMGGFSAGSQSAMWIAMRSTLLSAVAIASPPYDPSAYWIGTVRGRDTARVMHEFLQAGAPDTDEKRWRMFSPALNVDRIKAPLLMQISEQETRDVTELYAKLSNTATPVEMYAFPDEAHIKLQPRHRYSVYKRNLDWFRYWLQDYRDPDPALADQYRRWDMLRQRQRGSAE